MVLIIVSKNKSRMKPIKENNFKINFKTYNKQLKKSHCISITILKTTKINIIYYKKAKMKKSLQIQ